MNSLDKMEDYDRLAEENAKLREELATVATNAAYFNGNQASYISELQAKLDAAIEALEERDFKEARQERRIAELERKLAEQQAIEKQFVDLMAQVEEVELDDVAHFALPVSMVDEVMDRYEEGYECPSALKALLSEAREEGRKEAVPEWIDGEPPFPQNQEWFIAVTTYGDKVVLRALPEEYSYDYKTADETYLKAEKIAKWMQFPDSEYVTPSPASLNAKEGGE